MRILIEVELEEMDHPSYTNRVNDALLRLVASQIDSANFGEHVFEREWKDEYWGRTYRKSTTVVRVSKAPPAVPEMIEAEKKAREEVARIKADVAAALNFSPKGS